MRLQFSTPLAAAVSTVALVLATGCSTTLAGDWSGELDCDGLDIDIEFELDPEDGVFIGEGSIDDFSVDGYNAELTFEIELEKTSMFGDQELDASIGDCELDLSGYGSGEVDCEDPDNVEWDGEDTITGEVEGFLGSDMDCDLEVER
jgi:hypothetical protein